MNGATPLYLDAPFDSPYEVYRIDQSNVTIKGDLYRLDLGQCGVTDLNCSKLPALEVLLLTENPALKTLDLQNNRALRVLQIVRCGISSLETKDLAQLTHYYAGYSTLQKVDLSKNKLLEVLNVDKLDLTTLDLSGNKMLKSLSCSENKLTLLDLREQGYLEELDCAQNELKRVIFPPCSPLKKINVTQNKLTDLSLGDTPHLEHLACYSNAITPESAHYLLDAIP